MAIIKGEKMNLLAALMAPLQQKDIWQLLKSERLIDEVFSRVIKKGSLNIIDAFGQQHKFGNEKSPDVTIRLLDSELHHKIALNPELFIGEAFMEGRLLVEKGTLKQFFEIMYSNTSTKMPSGWLRMIEVGNFFSRRLQQLNTITNSAKNVKHHYDLPAEFYSLFLDSEKQYSCAYFTPEVQTLEEAQQKKIRHIVNKLLIKPNHRILDVGCGWGGLACSIAKLTGASVTGISLSEEQIKVAKQRALNEGVEKQVEFKLLDYRHLNESDNNEENFDRIVSVGMFEHVGIDHYPKFFRKMQSLLKDDGVMLLHSIGRVQGPSSTNAWIRKYIFPGGYIPALSEVIPQVESAGLHIADVEVLRLHYARTLQEWRLRFNGNQESIRKQYGEKFCLMWEFYLTGAEASFEHWGNMVFHLQLSKQADAVPLTREYLYQQMPGALS